MTTTMFYNRFSAFWLRSKEYFENALGLAGGLGSHGGSPNQGVTDIRRSAVDRHTEPLIPDMSDFKIPVLFTKMSKNMHTAQTFPGM